eukprot:CAMPEP_0177657786 /NCGR_PEP_ID=MMETSP0447-20121125/16410_1 /TAXON_ID=0 /ORGANISM="Stygamoeba regulata, Strain BSH-02190019" /LENGTH=141 /DNA_ID=CAMNT_0019162243 /DNA_START=338 /DNA_END=763 /DNA_ORIENTATION=+
MQGFESLTGADGGVLKKIIRPGVGDLPEKGTKVKVNYLVGGFDQCQEPDLAANHRLTFMCGCGEVIKGFDVAVSTMRAGEVAEVICLRSYVNGMEGLDTAFPSADRLRFVIELVEISSTPSLGKSAEAMADFMQRIASSSK